MPPLTRVGTRTSVSHLKRAMNKTPFNHYVLALLLSGAILTAPSALALSAKQANDLRKAVTSVPVPEMPAKAAELVQQAKESDRKEVAVTVVRAAVLKRRASGPVVVAAIAKVAPDLAGIVAKAASQIVTDQASNIAQAAIAAAPGQSDEILATVNNRTPQGPVNQIIPQQSLPELSPSTLHDNGSQAGNSANATVGSAEASAQASVSHSLNSGTATIVASTQPASLGANSVENVSAAPQGVAPVEVRPGIPPLSPAGSQANLTSTSRGEADGNGPSSGRVGHGTTPINHNTGGRGDGVFPNIPPTKTLPPHPKDYSKPRS
jgi:hypothetical protein